MSNCWKEMYKHVVFPKPVVVYNNVTQLLVRILGNYQVHPCGGIPRPFHPFRFTSYKYSATFTDKHDHSLYLGPALYPLIHIQAKMPSYLRLIVHLSHWQTFHSLSLILHIQIQRQAPSERCQCCSVLPGELQRKIESFVFMNTNTTHFK